MKIIEGGVAAVGLFLAFGAAYAYADEVDDLRSAVRSNICPADLSTYSLLSETIECRAEMAESNRRPSNETYNTWMACSRKVSEANKAILQYNEFMSKCRSKKARDIKPQVVQNGNESIPTEEYLQKVDPNIRKVPSAHRADMPRTEAAAPRIKDYNATVNPTTNNSTRYDQVAKNKNSRCARAFIAEIENITSKAKRAYHYGSDYWGRWSREIWLRHTKRHGCNRPEDREFPFDITDFK